MRRLGCVLAVGCAFVAGGCGVLGGGKSSVESVDDDQLAIMVVPKAQLGTPARAFDIDDDSGPYDNKEGAHDTVDPHDTAASLRAAGRVGGYELTYSSPKALDIWHNGGGYSDVTTSVELFETPSDAAAYLDTQARDFARFEGRTIQSGVRLTRTDVVRITDIADSAWVIHGTATLEKVVVHGTIVAFRHGRIVGAVSIGRGDSRDVTDQARIIARALDHRITAVLDGALTAEPVTLPGEPSPAAVKRLTAATLALQDLPADVTVGEEGRKSKSGTASYVRSFNVAGRPIFGSGFMTLTAESRLLDSENVARATMTILASPRGRQRVLAVFVREARIPTLHRSVAPLTGLPAGMTGSVLTLKTPKGPFVAFLVSMRAGKVVETVSAFGPATEMSSESMKAIAAKARARLHGAL
jgi:hypothetical protein